MWYLMSRPPFEVYVPGSYQVKLEPSPGVENNFSFPVNDYWYAAEASLGTARRRKPAVWCEPTGYTMDYTTYRRANGIVKGDMADGSKVTYSGVVGSGAFNSISNFDACAPNVYNVLYDASLPNRALIKARIKMKQASVNLGVAFAERNATARLLGDTASRIGKAFINVKRGQIRAAMRELGILHAARMPRGSNYTQKWLELQYGWKPLLSDVFGACEALSKAPLSDWRVTAKAYCQSQGLWSAVTQQFTTGQGAGICVAEAQRGAFCRIDALPSNDLIMSLSSLGITNPGLIAWELVPGSFIVDWALPIGQWLESIDALLGFEDAYVSQTAFLECDWRDVGRDQTDSFGNRWHNEYSGTRRRIAVRRVASKGVPLPTFPRIKDPRSLGHMANGLALLAGAFGYKR